MPRDVTHDELLEVLRSRAKASSLPKLAREMNMSFSFLGEIVRGEKQISERVALAMGYQRLTIFRKAS